MFPGSQFMAKVFSHLNIPTSRSLLSRICLLSRVFIVQLIFITSVPLPKFPTLAFTSCNLFMCISYWPILRNKTCTVTGTKPAHALGPCPSPRPHSSHIHTWCPSAQVFKCPSAQVLKCSSNYNAIQLRVTEDVM